MRPRRAIGAPHTPHRSHRPGPPKPLTSRSRRQKGSYERRCRSAAWTMPTTTHSGALSFVPEAGAPKPHFCRNKMHPKNPTFIERSRTLLWMQDRESYVHNQKLAQIKQYGDIPNTQQSMKKYKDKIDTVMRAAKKRHHSMLAVHFRRSEDATETERQNKIMLRKLVEIADGRRSNMRFRRVSA